MLTLSSSKLNAFSGSSLQMEHTQRVVASGNTVRLDTLLAGKRYPIVQVSKLVTQYESMVFLTFKIITELYMYSYI